MSRRIIQEGVIVYSRSLNQLRLGIGKVWEETPILLDIGAYQDVVVTVPSLTEDYYFFKENIEQRVISIEEQLSSGSIGDAYTLRGLGPDEFASATHTHEIANIISLESVLGEIYDQLTQKAPQNHFHNVSDIQDLLDEHGKIKEEFLPDEYGGGDAFSD